MADITTSTTPAPATPPENATEQAAHAATAAREQAADVAASAKDQAAAVASAAAGEARAIASEAAGEAKDIVADARQQLRAQADEQAEKVASLVGDIGSQLRTMAAAGDAGVARDLVATFADQAEQMSQRLGDGGLDRSLQDARRLARNRPGLFLAGAAIAGFVAARVARTADTGRLKEAAAPSTSGNGHGTPASDDRAWELAGATPGAIGGVPAPRRLVADPLSEGHR